MEGVVPLVTCRTHSGVSVAKLQLFLFRACVSNKSLSRAPWCECFPKIVLCNSKLESTQGTECVFLAARCRYFDTTKPGQISTLPLQQDGIRIVRRKSDIFI